MRKYDRYPAKPVSLMCAPRERVTLGSLRVLVVPSALLPCTGLNIEAATPENTFKMSLTSLRQLGCRKSGCLNSKRRVLIATSKHSCQKPLDSTPEVERYAYFMCADGHGDLLL
jgi:hypothetical protein